MEKVHVQDLQTLLKEGKITNKTIERVNIAKSYIEKKYALKKTQDEQARKDWEQITKELNELDISNEQKEELKQKFLHDEAERIRKTRAKITIRDFEPISIIGRGAFGEVRICRQKETGDIVAIKKMRKEDMLNKNQLTHVRTEKEILTANNPWIVNLKYSFQDEYFLYLVMNYCPGGDLMNLLMKKDILTEDEARFYTAEMILAVDSIHKLNCIHRDLKPDNILIDKNGHIQISDFGLSKIGDKTFFPMTTKDNTDDLKSGNNKDDTITQIAPTSKEIKMQNRPRRKLNNRLMAYSTVGTPDYIAPEVFGKDGYGEEVDWWSIGVMFFEMVVGFPPFFAEKPSDTCKKIVKWKQYFSIPSDANLSKEAKDLILNMVNTPDKRLGINGVEEIKRHPFFKGIDWNHIRETKAPFIPDIKNDWDNKYFDKFEEQEPFYPPISKKNKKRKDLNYAGYTFNRDIDNMNSGFVQALEVLEVVKKQINEQKGHEVIADSDHNLLNIDCNSNNLPSNIPSTGTHVNTTNANSNNKVCNSNNIVNACSNIKVGNTVCNTNTNSNKNMGKNKIIITSSDKKDDKKSKSNSPDKNLPPVDIKHNTAKKEFNPKINPDPNNRTLTTGHKIQIHTNKINVMTSKEKNMEKKHTIKVGNKLFQNVAGLQNKIIINNIDHKKISKSPENKNKLPTAMPNATQTIHLNGKRDGIGIRISPGKPVKEKVALVNKLKLDIGNKKMATTHLATHTGFGNINTNGNNTNSNNTNTNSNRVALGSKNKKIIK